MPPGCRILEGVDPARIRYCQIETNLEINCIQVHHQPLAPMMSDLPQVRHAYREPPFSNTGIDYFGPLYVSLKRSTENRWGFLFTCLTTRAVHFAVLSSMDTSSCMMEIEPFAARRGISSVLWSDNGTNFVANDKELLKNVRNWNQQVLAESLVKKNQKEVFGNV